MRNKSEGRVIVVIPARFGSTRLPGKPLLAETGKPLIQHVVEAAQAATQIDQVIVATDDRRILDAVHHFGGEAVLTDPSHPSGTDRVAEVAHQLLDAHVIVNLQGDEPEIEPAAIDRVVGLLKDDPDASMATLCTPIVDRAIYEDPSCVKTVVARNNRALYFSRSPIPCYRDSESVPPSGPLTLLHLGIYAYRRPFLMKLARMPPSPLELAEKLEQLRVLEAGEAIAIATVPHATAGIDTPDDYQRFVKRWSLRTDRAA